jgi:hypothetical protein
VVLANSDLVGLLLAALRSGGGEGYPQQATRAAHALCLVDKAACAAVLAAAQHVRAPAAWAPCRQLQSMAATLASLVLEGRYGEHVDPSLLPAMPCLTRLELRRCDAASAAAAWPNLGGLRHLGLLVVGGGLPPAVRRLARLTRLEAALVACAPVRLILRLTKLQALRLEDADGTWRGGRALRGLSRLSRLTSLAIRAPELRALPGSLGQLAALGSLDLQGCRSLQQLPESLDQLAVLGSLNLSGCRKLRQLPESLGQLAALAALGPDCHVGCSRPEPAAVGLQN